MNNSKLVRLACAILLGMLAIPGVMAQAVTLAQAGEPTPSPLPSDTPTPGDAGRLATPTPSGGGSQAFTSAPGTVLPTPTVFPPPSGGGRVAVDALYVRENSSFGAEILGIILYNQSVFPVGRNANNTWIAINWQDGYGWIFAALVVWDPELDFNTLPILAPAAQETPPDELLTLTTQPSATLPPTDTITPPATATLTPSPTNAALPTVVATVLNTALPTPITSNPGLTGSPSNSGFTVSPDVGIAGLGAFGLFVLGAVVFGWRRSVGARELNRYRDGFIMTVCPVCRQGHLQLDEKVRSSFGIPSVRRSVRCNNCRSLLRQIGPGKWRYTIDGFVNPELAGKYGQTPVGDSELRELANNTELIGPSDEPDNQSLIFPDPDWVQDEEGLKDNPHFAGTPADQEEKAGEGASEPEEP